MPLVTLIKVFLQEHRIKFIIALLVGLADTCVNVLLLLSLGKGMSLAFMDHSTKAGLFDLVIGGINTQEAFFMLFALLVAVKGLLVFLDHFLQDTLGESFVSLIRKMLINGSPVLDEYELSFSKMTAEYSPLKNLLTKGLIEAFGDFLFVSFLVVVFSLAMPLVAAAFFVLVVFYFVFTLLWSAQIEKRRKVRNEKRARWQKNMQLHTEEVLVLRAFNRQGALKRKWLKGLNQFHESQVRFFKGKAIGEGVFPLFFFSMLGLFIFLVDVRDNPADQFYSLLLLLLYSQGSMRRLSRLPITWNAAITAARSLPDRFFDEEVVEQSDARANELIIHTVDGKLLELVIKTGQLIIIDHQGSQRLKELFLQGIMDLKKNDMHFALNGESSHSLSSFQIRRSIAPAASIFPVFGQTIEEAIAFSKSEKSRDRIWRVLEKIKQYSSYDLKPEQEVNYTDQKLLLWLQLGRVEYTRKPFVVIDLDFSFLDRKEKLKVLDFIHYLKKKRGVLLLATTITEGMLVDQQIEL